MPCIARVWINGQKSWRRYGASHVLPVPQIYGASHAHGITWNSEWQVCVHGLCMHYYVQIMHGLWCIMHPIMHGLVCMDDAWTMICYGFLCLPMDNAFLCLPMASHAFLWFPMLPYDFFGLPMTSYDFWWFLLLSYDFRWFLMIFMLSYDFLCFPIVS